MFDLRARLADLVTLDLRSLGLFRVGLGLLLFVDMVYRAVDVEAFYTDVGIRPLDSGIVRLGGGWTPLEETGALWLPVLLLVVLGLSALLVASGRLWRVGLVGCWLTLQSFNLRNPLPLQVADAIHLLLLMWAFFLPLGERFVLGRPRDPEGPLQVRSVTTVLFLLQLLWVYMVPGYYKAIEPHWTRGALLIEAAFIDPVATGWLELLLGVPWLLEALSRVTPWFELFTPLLLLLPWWKGPVRTGLVLTFIGFHLLGIGMMLRLALVPFTLALCWVPLVPGWAWERVGLAEDPGPGRPPLGLPGPAAVVILVWGLGTFIPSAEHLVDARLPVPAFLRSAWHQTGLHQRRFSLWTRPAGNRLFMVAARLEDGRSVELHHGVPLDYAHPPRSPRNNHWYKTFQQLRDHEPVRWGVARWHVHDWERQHGPEARVEMVEVIVRQTPMMPPGWWTSGRWEDGLPEPAETRSLYEVVGEGAERVLERRTGQVDWSGLGPG